MIASVRLEAFAGAVEAWIDRDSWATFCKQLIALEQTRQGKAILESMSPGELRLCVRSLDRLGHMGIEGELTHYIYGEGARQPQSLSLQFGTMEFDPMLLSKVVAELATIPNGG
jgi:hypothetical protein